MGCMIHCSRRCHVAVVGAGVIHRCTICRRTACLLLIMHRVSDGRRGRRRRWRRGGRHWVRLRTMVRACLYDGAVVRRAICSAVRCNDRVAAELTTILHLYLAHCRRSCGGHCRRCGCRGGRRTGRCRCCCSRRAYRHTCCSILVHRPNVINYVATIH